MQVYEITPQYHLVRLGNEEPLDRPEQIVRYMEGAFAAEPTVESVWVIPETFSVTAFSVPPMKSIQASPQSDDKLDAVR